MGEAPKFNRNDRKEDFELLTPAEKFARLANDVLEQDPDPKTMGFIIEFTEVSWWGSETMNFYTLSRTEEIEGNYSYFLTISSCLDNQDSPASDTRYYVDPETQGQIIMLDETYDFVSPDELDHDPNAVALGAFDEYSPELVNKYKSPSVNERFGQIVGAYILSDRGLENRLDYALQLPLVDERREEVSGVVDEAIKRFELQMLHALRLEVGTSGAGTLAKDSFREVMYGDYTGAYADNVDQAVMRFAEGGGRQSDWTPADKLKRHIRNHVPEKIRRVQRCIGKAVAFATVLKNAQFGPGPNV